MNDQYPIGTVCIGQNFVNEPRYNNMRCEIISDLQMRWSRIYSGKFNRDLAYGVRWSDGEVTAALPRNLKLPPSDSQWADEAIRKLKKQSSDHVAGGSKVLIPEEVL